MKTVFAVIALCLVAVMDLAAQPCVFSTTSSTAITNPCGNVSIGTTTPNAGSKLDVRGGLSINQVQTTTQRGSGIDVGWTGSEGSEHADIFFGDYTNGWAIGENVDGSMRIFKTDGNTLSSTPLTIQMGGNVGIGTTSPWSKLTVAGAMDATYPDLAGQLFLYSTDSMAANKGGVLSFGGSFTGTAQTTMASVYGRKENGTDSNFAGYLGFLTRGSADTGTEKMRITSTGNVGIGTTMPSALLTVGLAGGTGNKLTVNGDITVTGINARYQDIVEWVPVTEPMSPGTVVVVSGDSSNTVTPSLHAYDTGVAGVVSGQPGLILGEAAVTKATVATTGRVKVRVDATTHPIARGDLLVTSDKPGTAMFSEPLDLGGVKIHRPGTLIGKALEPLSSGQGEILVLLSLQ